MTQLVKALKRNGLSSDLAPKLNDFISLFLKWNEKINLSAARNEVEVREHVMDSLNVIPHLPPGSARVIDVGSGGGFPSVVIAVCANLSRRDVAWKRLALPLLLIAAGIACVHGSEWQRLGAGSLSTSGLGWGMALALAALVCWTWYPLRNAAWVQANPQVGSGTWATAQGLATLPMALVGMTAYMLLTGSWVGDAPWGPRPWTYAGLMLAIGLLSSWLGTLCWNRASSLLPTSLAGQLIVFETLAAMAYGFMHRAAWPQPWDWAGMGLLVAGVVVGTRLFVRRP